MSTFSCLCQEMKGKGKGSERSYCEPVYAIDENIIIYSFVMQGSHKLEKIIGNRNYCIHNEIFIKHF